MPYRFKDESRPATPEIGIAEFFSLSNGAKVYIEAHFIITVPDMQKAITIWLKLDKNSGIIVDGELAQTKQRAFELLERYKDAPADQIVAHAHISHMDALCNTLQEMFRIRFRSKVQGWIGDQNNMQAVLSGTKALETALKTLDLSDLGEEVKNVFVTDIHLTQEPTRKETPKPYHDRIKRIVEPL